MIAKIFLNDSKTENFVSSDIFLPVMQNKRVMIGGNGRQCLIKSFVVKNVDLKAN
jgi:hypothetical protein